MKYETSESRTIEQKEWLKMRDDAKANKLNSIASFNNMALTVDGYLCIGMTHNKTWSKYSCTYTQIDGVRDFGGAYDWDLYGNSLDGFSDLDLSTIQVGVRVI